MMIFSMTYFEMEIFFFDLKYMKFIKHFLLLIKNKKKKSLNFLIKKKKQLSDTN